MCGIMAYCGAADRKQFIVHFAKTKSRGPDDTRVAEAGSGILGFHRLAIMGLNENGMQPFEFDDAFAVINGEIYGFQKLKNQLIKKGYVFKSDSDCGILLPLYREYGTDLFSMLDAEFACVIYDAKTDEYIAARDPIGIRPLYYGYDKDGTIVFASEPKNLVGITKKIIPFPTGHYYKDGKFYCYNAIAERQRYSDDDIETVCKNIREKLIAGVKSGLFRTPKSDFCFPADWTLLSFAPLRSA